MPRMAPCGRGVLQLPVETLAATDHASGDDTPIDDTPGERWLTLSFVTAADEPWAEAGGTWWVESWWDLPDSPDGRAETERRLRLGPPR